MWRPRHGTWTERAAWRHAAARQAAHLCAAACPICRRAGPARARWQSCARTATRRAVRVSGGPAAWKGASCSTAFTGKPSAAHQQPGRGAAAAQQWSQTLEVSNGRQHLERWCGHQEPAASRHTLRHLKLAAQEGPLQARNCVLPQRVQRKLRGALNCRRSHLAEACRLWQRLKGAAGQPHCPPQCTNMHP